MRGDPSGPSARTKMSFERGSSRCELTQKSIL
jgi:hypothetical protein